MVSVEVINNKLFSVFLAVHYKLIQNSDHELSSIFCLSDLKRDSKKKDVMVMTVKNTQ